MGCYGNLVFILGLSLCLGHMWFLGHLSLGYFSAYATSKYTGERMVIPVVWIASMLPDLDAFFYRYMVHRGPSHSIIVAVVASISVLIVFGRRSLPYLAALASHILIGDYFVPPTQMFWPLSNAWYGAPQMFQLHGTVELLVEVFLFALMACVILFRRRIFVDSPRVLNFHKSS
jgi:membrane-bound metal-dependent hydrolase YbcI (DUF457 family)